MSKSIKILFAEDSLLDFELAADVLKTEGLNFTTSVVETEDDFKKQLHEFQPDIVITDFHMPAFNGLHALAITKSFNPRLPVIILTGSISEETAVDCMRAGANNYVLKENLVRLPFAVIEALENSNIAIENHNSVVQIKQNEEKFRSYLNHAPDAIFISDRLGRFVEVNSTATLLSGYSEQELLKLSIPDLFVPGTIDINTNYLEKIEAAGEANYEFQALKKDGSVRWWSIKGVRLPDEQYMGFVSDINEKKTAETALLKSEQKYKKLISEMKQGLVLHEVIVDEHEQIVDYRFLDMNEHFEQLTGLKRNICIGHRVKEIFPDKNPYWIENGATVAITGEAIQFQDYFEESKKYYDVIAFSPQKRQFAIIINDVTESVETESKLKKSEEMFRLLAENSADMLFMLDLNLNYTYVSPAIEKLNGYTVQETMVQKIWDILTPESVKSIKELFKTQMALEATPNSDPGRTAHIEFEEYHKNGQLIIIETSLSFLRDENAKAIGIVGISRDVTNSKELEKALKLSEERFRKVVEENQAVVWEVDKNGLYTYLSPMSLEVFGYHPNELIEKKYFYDLFPEEERAAFLATTLELFPEKKIFKDFINRIEKKDGNLIWVSTNASPILDEKGDLNGYRGSDQNVTIRFETQNQLKENELRLRLTLQAAQLGLFDLNLKTGEAIVNDLFANMLGYELDEYTDDLTKWKERVHLDDILRLEKTYQDYISGTISEYKVEFRQQTKSGEYIWIMSLGSIVEWHTDGTPLRMLGTNLNINERKNAEIQLQQKIEELERFNNLTVGRELKMISLKKEINELLIRLGENIKYKISGSDK